MRQTIPVEAIKACALFAAAAPGRYAFNGLLLEHGKLVATDGRRMVVATWTPAEGDEAGKVVIPVEQMEAAARVRACVQVIANGKLSTITQRKSDPRPTPGPEFPCDVIDGDVFPDCDAVMRMDSKREAEAGPVAMNPAYLADIGKATALVQAESEAPTVTIRHTGKATAIYFEAQGPSVKLVGLLMPITS